MNLTDIFLEKSQASKSGIFFIDGGYNEEFLPYNDLKGHALLALFSLQKEGLKPGDELLLQVEDNRQFIIIFWACILGGIIPVPLSIARNEDNKKKLFQVWSLLNNPSLAVSGQHIEQLIGFADKEGMQKQGAALLNRAYFVEDILNASKPGNVYRPQENEIAFVQFSSGSTGNPKGVVLTHKNLIANINAISNAASYNDTDSMLSWMPLSHDMGMIGFHLNPLVVGINQYHIPTSLFIRNPRLWFDKIAEHRITITCSPNFGYRYFLKNLKANQYQWDLSHVRIIYNGAEPISESLCIEFIQEMMQYGLNERAICPVYGLAEASVAVSISEPGAKLQVVRVNRHRLNPGDRVEESAAADDCIAVVNVGKPIKDCAVKLTDIACNELGEDTIGSIRIKGKNVTQNYYNRQDLFQQSIDLNGWLDTGDLGFIRDGALHVTGRAKDVIFANGQNYYSHDIEKEAEAIEGVELNKFVVCGSFSTEKQTEEIVGFLLHRGTLEALVPIVISLKQFVNEKFGFGIDKIIPVKEIPKTTSGKLKRHELMSRYISGEFRAIDIMLQQLMDNVIIDPEKIAGPFNAFESNLLRIWQDVLHRSDFGINQSFFQLGGSSLKAAEVTMKIQQQMGIVLPLERLYELQTIQKIAANIDDLKKYFFEQIQSTAQIATHIVSASQRRMYYVWKINPQGIAYNIPVTIKLGDDIQHAKLEICLRQLIERHDALRMVFTADDEPRCKVVEHVPLVLNLIYTSPEDFSSKLTSLVLPFDLINGPLFRFILINDTYLFMDFHHIISDGNAVLIFVRELLQLYNGACLPPLPVSFFDFVVWERQRQELVDEEAKNYWNEQFTDGITTLELPYDFHRAALQDNRGKRFCFDLNKKMTAQLTDFCQASNLSTYAFLLTVYHILLAKFSGQEDVVIGVPFHGRTHPDIQGVLGMFVRNLPVRSEIREGDTFIDLLRRNFKLLGQAIDHHDWPFENIVNNMQKTASPGRAPFFDTMFLYQDWNEILEQRHRFDPCISKFDLTLEVVEGKDHLSFEFEYATSLFAEDTISRLAIGILRIIQLILENPKISVAELSPLSEQEITDITAAGPVDETVKYRSVTVLFEEQAKLKPEAAALEFEGVEFSYAELDAKANQFATNLIGRGIGKADLVGIHLKRSPELMIAIIGVLKAGAAYLPLEYDTPAERISFILDNSRCNFLISDLKPDRVSTKIVAFSTLIEANDNMLPAQAPEATDLAYVIYTSGSTGTPKGVMINHENLFSYINWAADRYTAGEPCSFALYSSISFDLTATSLFVPLITGNKLIIYSEDATDVAIAQVLRDNKTTILKLTPAHLRLLILNNLLSAASSIKKLIVGGEAFESSLASEVYSLTNGKIEMFNEYGPTEATVGCMFYQFNNTDNHKTVPIGRPIPDTQIYILDKCLGPAPIQVPGEIYIAGRGVAQGYLFDDEMTAGKFINNPYKPGSKMYKTGDMAKMLPNRNIVYLGRNDNQVKVNGNRVELSEVEAQLNAFPGINEVIVLPDIHDPNGLTAFIVTCTSFLDLELRDHLARVLPYFMIPQKFIRMEAMPLTKNGKVDTAKLKAVAVNHLLPGIKVAETRVEKALVAIWEDVLHTQDLGVTDNFFEHGGDSIKAVQISSKLFEQGISIKVKDILTYHTIESISRHAIYNDLPVNDNNSVISGEIKTSPIQSWFFSHRFKKPECYTQSALFRIHGQINIDVFNQAMGILLRHHDALRLNYNNEKRVLFYNNGHLNTTFETREFEIDEGIGIDGVCDKIRHSFNLSNGLLFKAALLKMKDGATSLFLSAHHLVVDGISWRILLEDLNTIYTALSEGKSADLPPSTASYKDWSESLYDPILFSEEKHFWKEMEQGTLSAAFDVKDYSVSNSLTELITLEPEMTKFLLSDAHKPYNTDVLIILNTVMVMSLHLHTGFNEFIIEQENHGRGFGNLNVSRTVGWFTAIYPLKFLYKEETGALIKSVKEALRKVPNIGIGYGVNTILDGNESRIGLSEVRINYLGDLDKGFNTPLLSLNSLDAGKESHPENTVTALIECNCWVSNGICSISLTGNLDVFKENPLTDFSESFLKNLNVIIKHLKDEDTLHFTPSDFPSAGLQEEEIHDLFND